MQIKTDFYNNTQSELDAKYFPKVKYYRDDKNYTIKQSYLITVAQLMISPLLNFVKIQVTTLRKL